MAAELGTTTDPKALVPGLAGSLLAAADSLRGRATDLELSGNGLGKVDVGGWTGVSSDAFAERLAAEPVKWLRSADALTSAAEAITGYADTLMWAQSQAREAIDLWERGDPGDDLRAQARELLDRARKQLKAAGDEAAGGLGEPFQLDGQELVGLGRKLIEPWLNKSGSIEARTEDAWAALDWYTRGPFTENGWTGPGGDFFSDEGFSLGNGHAGAYALRAGFDAQGNFHGIDVFGRGETAVGAEADFSGTVGVYGADIEAAARAGAWGSLDAGASYGPASVRHHLEYFAGVEANAHAHAGLDGIDVGAGGVAGARISDELSGQVGPFGGHVRGDAFAGAEANASAGIGAEGAHAHAGAFAGAKAGVEAGGEVGGLGLNVGAEARAGAGGDAGFGATHEDGKITFDASAGAAAVIGAGANASVTVDTNEVADNVTDLADKVTPW